MTAEKRTTERKIMRARATVTMEDVVPLSAKTLDISPKGISITFEHKLAVGHIGDISFEMYVDGYAQTITCRSRVIYCIFSGDSFKVGLEFVTVPADAAAAIAKFMRW